MPRQGLVIGLEGVGGHHRHIGNGSGHRPARGHLPEPHERAAGPTGRLGISSDRASIICFVGAVMTEQQDHRQEARRYVGAESSATAMERAVATAELEKELPPFMAR